MHLNRVAKKCKHAHTAIDKRVKYIISEEHMMSTCFFFVVVVVVVHFFLHRIPLWNSALICNTVLEY